MNINRVEISGHVAGDVDVRKYADGTPVIRFDVAVSSFEKTQGGKVSSLLSDIRCVASGEVAKALERVLEDGTRLAIAGRIRKIYWNDVETGERRTRTEVVVEQADVLTPKRSNVFEADIDRSMLDAAFMNEMGDTGDEG